MSLSIDHLSVNFSTYIQNRLFQNHNVSRETIVNQALCKILGLNYKFSAPFKHSAVESYSISHEFSMP